jgi:hypothetical protein
MLVQGCQCVLRLSRLVYNAIALYIYATVCALSWCNECLTFDDQQARKHQVVH